MTRYELRIENGHLLAYLPTGLALVDTGSPVSYGRRPLPPSWPAPSSGGDLLAIVSGHVGVQLDHLIGVEALAAHGRVLIDLVHGWLVINPTAEVDGYRVSMPCKLGVPRVPIAVSGTDREAFLDTGAQLSYAPRSSSDTQASVGSETDFFPGVGEFQTPTFRVELRIGNESLSLLCGRLPEGLPLAFRDDWIVGLDFFRERAALLDFRNGHLTFSPRTLTPLA